MKQKLDMPVPQFVEDYLEYQKFVKKSDTSEKTIKAYRGDIFYFFEWIKSYKNINEITLQTLNELIPQDVFKWVSTLNNRGNKKPLSASTQGRKFSAIHSLFRYLNKYTEVKNEVARELHQPPIPIDNTTKYLTREVATKLKNKIYESGSERDFAIIMVFLNAGVRISELINLNLNSLDEKKLTVIKSKGNKSRDIVVNPETVDAIKRYLEVRPKTKDNAMFLLDYFEGDPYRITRASVENMIEKYRKLCKIKHCTAHTLRHTFATLKREAGATIPFLQDTLGHEDEKTTYRYAKLTIVEKERMAEIGSI